MVFYVVVVVIVVVVIIIIIILLFIFCVYFCFLIHPQGLNPLSLNSFFVLSQPFYSRSPL